MRRLRRVCLKVVVLLRSDTSALQQMIPDLKCLFLFVFMIFKCKESLAFSVEHLGDVQELLGHLEGGVQVADGVVLRTRKQVQS